MRAVGTRGRAPARRRARGLIPWSVAAASLLLAAYLAFPPGPSERPLAELRSDLVADASDVVVVGWTSNDDPAAAGGVEGDVVWSTTLQRGYLRFRGLEVNDPTKSQYQLWIFDREQDERYPIDGGVFDVGAEGETIVSIDPRIRVADPYLFAVTIEKPGGVVVSTRERLPVLAKLGS